MSGAGRTTAGILLGLALCAQWGCANPCVSQADKVEALLRKARQAHADLYASDAYGKALRAQRQAQEECRSQAATFMLFRSYRVAQALLNEASERSERVLAQAAGGEARARQEALNSRYEAGMAVNDALLATQRLKALKGDSRIGDLLGRVMGLQSAMGVLQQKIDAGDYLGAREMGVRIRTEAIRLQSLGNRQALPGPTP